MSFKVSGRVQGVGFRYFLRSEANKQGLSGWVRNVDTGEVEGEVWGNHAKLELFFQKLNQGPSLARVDKLLKNELEISESMLTDKSPNFHIRPTAPF